MGSKFPETIYFMRNLLENPEREGQVAIVAAAFAALIGLAVCKDEPQQIKKLDPNGDVYQGIAEIRKKTFGTSPDPRQFWQYDGKNLIYYQNFNQPAVFDGNVLTINFYGERCLRYSCDENKKSQCVVEELDQSKCPVRER